MKKEKVVVIDYGLGNLFSVQRALEHCGASNVCISSAIDDVLSADRLILPGVGAFEDGIRGLKNLGLIEPIKNYTVNKKPLLGICLGMQLLATTSQEFGSHVGLNLIPGNVLPIPTENSECGRIKVPFIGWAKLSTSEKKNSENIIINELGKNLPVYLVHSYYYSPVDIEHIVAIYDYQGEKITAAIRSDNVYGFQFHPEKSGEVGLGLLRAFLNV
jgi:glutamine amidotransferase